MCDELSTCAECVSSGCYWGILLDWTQQCAMYTADFRSPRIYQYVNGCDDRTTYIPMYYSVLFWIGWSLAGIFIVTVIGLYIVWRVIYHRYQAFPGNQAQRYNAQISSPSGDLPDIPTETFNDFMAGRSSNRNLSPMSIPSSTSSTVSLLRSDRARSAAPPVRRQMNPFLRSSSAPPEIFEYPRLALNPVNRNDVIMEMNEFIPENSNSVHEAETLVDMALQPTHPRSWPDPNVTPAITRSEATRRRLLSQNE